MIGGALLAYIPSPPANGISIGSFRLHVYGLLIVCGIVAAVWLAQRRWSHLGGAAGTMTTLAVWGVPGGLVGARLYSDITSWQVNTGGDWVKAFEIWNGGLGIWGGIIGGVITGAIGARRANLRLGPLLDCTAPALALAQAVGRWGNYFNQELYGRPSSLPWAVKIDNPTGYAAGTTFQPTFLYESLWDLIVVGLLLWTEKKLRVRRGYLIAWYAAYYTFGRFFIEYLRIDPAHKYFGLRLNDWTSVLVFVGAAAVIVLKGRARPGEEMAGDPLPNKGQRARRQPALVGASSGEEDGPPATPANADSSNDPAEEPAPPL